MVTSAKRRGSDLDPWGQDHRDKEIEGALGALGGQEGGHPGSRHRQMGMWHFESWRKETAEQVWGGN